MIKVLPLDFMGNGALLEPVDRKLHDLAVDYCQRELQNGNDINLSKLNKVWIGLKDGEAFGLCGYAMKLDIPVFRATNSLVLRALADRVNNFFCDQGCRGNEAFIHISKRERPEQRCPEWAEVLREWDAQSADRVTVKVR